jgi:hypothetical protein
VAEAAVRAVPMVVLDIDPQDPSKLPAPDDQQLIKARPAGRPTQRPLCQPPVRQIELLNR